MLKQSVLRRIITAVIGTMIFTSNIGWSQTAKIVVGGNATAKDTVKGALIYSTTSGVKFPDGTTQTTASPITIGTGTSIINNLGGGNHSEAALSIIASGKNDSIYGNADYAVILGGKNNVIENQSLNFSSSIPAPVNPGSHNFISGGEFNRIKPNANHSAIIGGRNNTIATGAVNSIILGGSSITATQPNTVYMQKTAVTDLALSGSGYRMVMVDSSGNFVASRTTAPPNDPNWFIGVPWYSNGSDASIGDVLGTRNNIDLSIVTSGIERMRIMQDGFVGIGTVPNIIPSTRGNTNDIDPNHPYALDILGNTRVLIGGTTTNNIVFKAVHGSSAELDHPAVGIGTEDPVRALHIVTKHLTLNPPPPPSCPTCLTGPHNGMRLEDFYNAGQGPLINTIWDIAPEYNTASHTGMLVLGTGDPANDYTLNGKMVLLDNGNVGVGQTNPTHKLDVDGDINISTGHQYLLNGQPIVNEWQTNGNDIYNTNTGRTKINGPLIVGATNILDGIKPTFAHDDFWLAVAGPLVAQSAWVTMTGWGDFVFGKEYNRMNWQEKKNYYNTNKHLVGMPSAKEIETKGLDLGDALKTVTVNVEENSLDIVDLYQRLEKLEKENQQLKEEVVSLKKKK